MSATYTPEQINEQLAEAKRCKTFVDILNGDTPCLGVTSGFLEGALNVGLSAAVRLGEIVEQFQTDLRTLKETCDENARLEKAWKQEIARVEQLRAENARLTADLDAVLSRVRRAAEHGGDQGTVNIIRDILNGANS